MRGWIRSGHADGGNAEMCSRKILLPLVAALAMGASARGAAAQDWPTHTVSIISPFSAGSGVDLLARNVANELQEKLGKPFIVDNRSGANGNVGAAVAAKAAPDGYTLLIVTPGIAVQNKYVYKTMPFDFDHDFSPIVLIAKAPMLIMVNNSLPVHSLAEMLAYAKAYPGKLHVSSTGVGSQPHITLERLKQLSGTDMIHVPYNSSGQQNSDLISGQIEVGINYVTTTLGLVQAGSVRPLAITSTKRMKELPNVPTMEELGYPDFEAVGWYGIFAPHGTPDTVAAKINPIVNAYLKTDKAQDALSHLGMQAAGGTAQDLKDWVKHEDDRWGSILKTVIVPQ
jgi:tripartite-type tricarboxylate transporter receptor subunit TctC